MSAKGEIYAEARSFMYTQTIYRGKCKKKLFLSTTPSQTCTARADRLWGFAYQCCITINFSSQYSMSNKEKKAREGVVNFLQP